MIYTFLLFRDNAVEILCAPRQKMSVPNDCSPPIRSNERALATSKTIPYFRPGEVYALRGRDNANPCGTFGPCIYMIVRPVTCSPCDVDLTFTTRWDDLQNAHPRSGAIRYTNSTGALQLYQPSGAEIPNVSQLVTYSAFNNRLTCVNLNLIIIKQLLEQTSPSNIIRSSFAFIWDGAESLKDYCCTPNTSYYARLLPASCTPCACEEDVDCGPCCPPRSGCGCAAEVAPTGEGTEQTGNGTVVKK